MAASPSPTVGPVLAGSPQGPVSSATNFIRFIPLDALHQQPAARRRRLSGLIGPRVPHVAGLRGGCHFRPAYGAVEARFADHQMSGCWCPFRVLHQRGHYVISLGRGPDVTASLCHAFEAVAVSVIGR